jgi:predicted component of type VI protein secretion system
MIDTEKAWLAGIIDGEGSIFVMKQKRKDRERDTNYILRVSVQSTDSYMAQACRDLAGGPVIFEQQDKRPNQSNTLKWELSGKKAAAVLEEVLPFLRVKQEQALLAIEFQKTTKKHWKNMLDVDYENQANFYLELKAAKQRLKIGKRLFGSQENLSATMA